MRGDCKVGEVMERQCEMTQNEKTLVRLVGRVFSARLTSRLLACTHTNVLRTGSQARALPHLFLSTVTLYNELRIHDYMHALLLGIDGASGA